MTMTDVADPDLSPATGQGGQYAGDPNTPDRNEVFGNLVQGDGDIVGLVAYSIYKQNKHDWLIAFNKARGRDPDDNEVQSYIIGESTPRRLATYRHLAEATLDGRGPTTPAGPGTEGLTQRNYAIAARHLPVEGSGGPQRNWTLIGLVGLAVIAIVGVVLMARAGFFTPPK